MSDATERNFVDIYLNRTKSDLLINGYIKTIEREMNMIIPKPIIALFISFYCQILPPYVASPKCHVDHIYQMFSTRKGYSGLNYVIFNAPWSKGKHELVFKCIHDNKVEIGVGLITNYTEDTVSGWIFHQPEAGITYQIYSCRRTAQKPGIFCYEVGKQKFVEHIDKPIKDGMVIAARVDLDEFSIKFYLNDK